MLLRSSAGLGQLCIHDFFSLYCYHYFSVTAMYIISYSSCAALNKSVEVAQGLTTFFNLVYLGVKRGEGKMGENLGTIG